MSKYSTNYEILQVNSSRIFSDPTYQRNLDAKRVRQIVKNFDPNLVNPIKVSYRKNEDRYYVFDGQHTLAALKLKHGGDLAVNCHVWHGLTPEDEAWLFAQQNGISRNVNAAGKLKALYRAGDQDVRKFVDVTNLVAHMRLTYGSGRNRIQAYTKAYSMYKDVGENDYYAILKNLRDAWDGVEGNFNTELLGGMRIFHMTYKDQYNQKMLVRKLSKISPFEIIREGKVSRDPGDTKYARQILRVYNKGLRSPLSDRL